MSDEGDDEAIIAALRSPELEPRVAAIEALLHAPRPLSTDLRHELIACLAAPTKAVQRRAADALRVAGGADQPAVLDELRRATRSDDARMRWGAVFALGRLGTAEPQMLPALLEAMGAADGDQRWAAAEIAIACARAHPSATKAALFEALASENALRRKMAIYVVRDLGLETSDVTSAVVAALRDDDAGVRLAALSAVSRFRSPPPTACDDVVRILRDDPDPGIRRAAMSALGHVGRDNDAAREILARATTSDDVGLRRAAEGARRRLDSARTSRT